MFNLNENNVDNLKSILRNRVTSGIYKSFTKLGSNKKSVDMAFVGYKFIDSLETLDYSEEVLETILEEDDTLEFVYEFITIIRGNNYSHIEIDKNFQELIKLCRGQHRDFIF